MFILVFLTPGPYPDDCLVMNCNGFGREGNANDGPIRKWA